MAQKAPDVVTVRIDEVDQAGGEYGEAASDKLMTVDLARNPGAYVRYRCIESTGGRLVVAVMNQTPRSMRDIRFSVTYSEGAGTATVQKSTTGTILPNQVARVETGVPVSRIYDCPVKIMSASFVDQD